MNLFKGVDSKFRRNMSLAKKHNKSLRKMQANNAKAMSTCAEAIKAHVKPKEVKPKDPKGGSSKLNQLSYIAHPKLGNVLVPASFQVSGSARHSPRPRLGLRPSCSCSSASNSGSGLQRYPGYHEGSRVEASLSANMRTEGLV